MLRYETYYIVEIVGDKLIVIAERDTFADCLQLRRDAEAMRPASAVGIANANHIQLPLGDHYYVFDVMFDGSVLAHGYVGAAFVGRITIGRFATLGAAIAACQAFPAAQSEEAA